MAWSDPIADMLTRIRNALQAQHEQVLVPASRVKKEIARILQEEGFIHGYEALTDGPRRMIRIRLKYTEDRRPVLSGLQRASRPGQRLYTSRDEIPRVRGGLGFAILSTPKGVMTGEAAWKAGVGGEVVCYIW